MSMQFEVTKSARNITKSVKKKNKCNNCTSFCVFFINPEYYGSANEPSLTYISYISTLWEWVAVSMGIAFKMQINLELVYLVVDCMDMWAHSTRMKF
jgi:hypothetical protein